MQVHVHCLADLLILLEVGDHHNSGCVHLPYHTPEVIESGRYGTLGGYVAVGVIEPLERKG